MTDAEAHALLRLVAKADEKAFRKLYEGLSTSVRRMAWSVLKDESDAVEIVDDTFMAIWKQASEFEARGGSTVKTWVLGIARLQALMLRRKRKPTYGTDSIEEFGDLQGDENVIPGGQNWLNADALSRCANGLDPTHRQVLALRSVEGLTNGEVGETLGKPEGTIKRLFHEACKLMRRCLEKGGFGNPVPA